MRVVLDTNIIVIVSRYLVTVGIPAQIMAAWRLDRFEPIVSPALLTEYERLLNYERLRRRHGLSHEEVADEVTELANAALLVEPTDVSAVIAADPDDDHVLAAAVAGEAECIVNGAPDFLQVRQYQGIRILSPAAFVAFLETE